MNEITQIVNSIVSTTTQTNSLAFNVELEDLRIVEHKKGVAGVAEEIRTLAEKSAKYIRDITNTVFHVQNSFDNLADHSNDILKVIDRRVKSDYDYLAKASENKKNDELFLDDLSQENKSMVEEMNKSLEELSCIIQSIANNLQETTTNFRSNIEKYGSYLDR